MQWPNLVALKDLKWWGWLVVRFGVYSLLFTLLRFGNHSQNQTLIGLSSGILYADYLTWLMRKLFKFAFSAEFALEGTLNVMLAIVVMKLTGIALPTDGEGLAMGFLAFLFTAGLKMTAYMLLEAVEQPL